MLHERRLLSIVMAGSALVAVAAVGLWRAELARGERVLVVGDSLAHLSADALQHEGDRQGFDVRVNAVPGITLAQRLPVLRDLAGDRSDIVVVELGTNDVFGETSQPDLDSNIDQAVAALHDARCVEFVDVGVLVGPLDAADHFNEHLKASMSGHPNMHVYDWAADYRQNSSWSADAVHLKPEHLDDYARAVMATTRAACPS